MNSRLGVQFAVFFGLATLIFSCATQRPLAHDDVDRLFLKYAEIAQRRSPMSLDEIDEVSRVVGRVRSSMDTCLATKFLKLYPVTSLLTANVSTEAAGTADMQNRKAEAKQYLRGLQNAPASDGNCPYSGFPPIQIN